MTRVVLLAVVMVVGVAALPGPVAAKEANLRLPQWTILSDLTVRYVDQSGSDTKFLQDYNLETDVDAGVTVTGELADDRSVHIDARIQPVGEQGYLIGQLQRLERYSLLVDVSASQTFFNARDGEDARTRSGTPLAGNFFPFTNDSRVFFGNGDPSIHRVGTGARFEYQPRDLLHDFYLDFHFRSVDGDETLLKGSTVRDPAELVPGSGPGTVAFDFPSRKTVDYQTFAVTTGAHAPVADINWQTDASYEFSSIDSTVREANFGASAASTEVELFREDSDVHVAKYDLVGSRHLRPNLYVYGAYLFSYERNDPKPTQLVSNASVAIPFSTSRNTSSGNVHRLGNQLGFGLLYRPFSTVSVTANTQARGDLQTGNINEDRDEFQFFVGDIGRVRNESDRDWVTTTTRVALDWVPMARMLFRTHARYQYRWAATDSTRSFDFAATQLPERQNYTNRYNRVEAGPSLRYNFGHGRTLEIGYTFLYEDVDVSIDELANDYIQDDYLRRRHTPYLRAKARLMKHMRGELRFQYENERRELTTPRSDPVEFVFARGGETTWEAFSVVPSLWYQPITALSLYSSVSVAQQRLKVDGLRDQAPAIHVDFRDFEYDVLTETVTAGASYTPSDRWSAGVSYTYVHSGHRSVRNQLHRGEISGKFKVSDDWDVRAGYRYLRYNVDDTNRDDYRANIPFVGVNARF